MNRQDIIDKMTPSEKEVFEKYSNTVLFPLFPIEDFMREIGIQIIVNGTIPQKDCTYKIIDNIFSIIIHPELATDELELRESLAIMLMGYFFDDKANDLYNDKKLMLQRIRAAIVFLLPTEVLENKIKEMRLLLLNEKKLVKTKNIGMA